MPEPVVLETLTLPSDLEQLPLIDSVTDRLAREMGFDDSARADLGICVTEAASNAIVHAHRQRPDLPIEIEYVRLETGLQISVRDHGGGFDLEGVPDPTLPENLLKLNGRGLLLIRSLMDRVEVTRLSDGTRVVMLKNLQPRANTGEGADR